MKVVFALHYAQNERNFGTTDGGTSYGNRLMEHVVKLRRRLESKGVTVLTRRDIPLEQADVAVFGDLDEALWAKALALPRSLPCILICTESPIYTPMSHIPQFIFHRRWSRVLTWNRSYEGDHIWHYDIAVAGATESELRSAEAIPSGSKKDRGVVITTLKVRQRGLAPICNALYSRLAREGLVDIYGAGWPTNPARGTYGATDDKVGTMRQYRYALCSENALHPGYVTEKLPDSIIAGIPAIYHGELETAARRFPGTFVPLEQLTHEGLLAALQDLNSRYASLLSAVRREARSSAAWDENFIDTFCDVLDRLRREMPR
jgi:hypothetical protein